MASLTCRLLPFAEVDGFHNMAADETMLESAMNGIASLRFYTWSVPTVSLGYFQPAAARDQDPLLAQLPFVRRPTGGDAIVHHWETTYALALPPGLQWQGKEPWPQRIHGIIVLALAKFGLTAGLLDSQSLRNRARPESTLCFQHVTACDVVSGESKIVGSAQRRRKGALLQHGSILMAKSPFAPALPGILELSGQALTVADVCSAVAAEFRKQTAWYVKPSDWTDEERRRTDELVECKYRQENWNRKR